MALLTRVFLDAILPLGIAYALVSFLADPDHIVTSDLRANSLLMNTHPLFREVAPSDEFRVALTSSAILLPRTQAASDSTYVVSDTRRVLTIANYGR